MPKIDSYCGLCCETCGFRETMNCGGCIATGGKPFHGRCDVADCVNDKRRDFCGDCEDFPCALLKQYSFDPVHGDNGARIENVRWQKAQRVTQAREGVDPVGVCGHHCDHCFFGPWCGGCRSGYDCCSYAGICEGGVCPNRQCAAERQLDGCYACAELVSCTKGYFGAADGYTEKAASIFVRDHGKQAFSAAMDALENDATALRDAGSLRTALDLLEGR